MTTIERKDVGEEWVEEAERVMNYKRFGKESLVAFIRELLSQREAGVRQETIAECVERIERNRVVLRDEKDHLPNAYQYLKGKNDLRDELLQALQPLSPNQK